MNRGGVLITGGAGYIGSHVVAQLGGSERPLVVLDDLSTGRRDAVLYGDLVVGNTGDAALVGRVLREYRVTAVLHFAAHIVVPESVSDPLKYYGNNTCNTRTLLECCAAHGVESFIFSSTAAVYGIPARIPVAEAAPTAPINPYGCSKLMSEWMLRDLARACGLRYVILRYFNVAGADPEGRIGQATPEATHLIKVACEAVTGARGGVAVFGTDYPTPDGTCIRDYIHVTDLAEAHVAALRHLAAGGPSLVLNCGYGHGSSVQQVLETVQRIGGVPLNITRAARRAGDPPALVADARLLRETLDWRPRHDDLDTIVATALAWERRLRAARSATQ